MKNIKSLFLTLIISAINALTFGQSILVYPKDSSVFNQTEVQLEWNNFPGANTYHLQIAEDPSFNILIIDNSNLTSLSFLAQNLTSNETFFWRVKPNNSIWSNPYIFTLVDFRTWPELEFMLDPDSVILDGNSMIEQWDDLSGNGHHFLQGTQSRRPSSLLEIEVNNKPIIVFNPDSTNYLDGPNLSLLTEGEIFSLTKRRTYIPPTLLHGGIWKFSDNGQTDLFPSTTPNVAIGFGRNTRFLIGDISSQVDITNYHILNIQSSSTFNFNINKLNLFSSSSGSTNFTTNCSLGKSFGNYYFDGSFGQILLFNTVLSDSLRDLVHEQLRHKYAPPANLGRDITYSLCDSILYPGKHFTSYLWSDGSTADSLIVSQSGTYWVEVEDIFGNISSDTIEVTLSEFNYPEFPNYCPSESTTWNPNLGEHYTYLWSDGSAADTLAISTAGAYHVTVTDTNGCVFQSDTLTFAEDPFSTTATLGSDKDLCSGNKLSLITGANEATDYVWNTGETTSEIEITTSGTYSVAVQNANGCSVKDTIAITIIGDAPNILADVPAYVCTAAPFAYEDLSSTTDGSSIVSSDWNFGNGETASATQGSFAYATAGNYDITLTIATSSGCFNTTTVPIEVKANPSLSFTSTNSCQRQEIVFNGGQFSPQTITNWSWNFGDPASGTANTANGQNVEHTFYVSGDYDIMLIGTDIFGCVDTLLQNKTIDPAPVVSFIFEEVCEGNVVSFQNASTIVAPAEIATYQWDFGDGTNSGQMHPQKPYASQGSYAVELTAIANNNCHTSAERTIKIHAFPQIGFDIEQDCAGVSTQFSDASYIPNGSVAKVEWAFDSESPTTGFVLNRTFENSGIYTLNQTVTSGFGCLSSKTSAVAIKDFLQAGFDFSPAAFVTDYPIVFESTSTGANEYHWSFGDFATAQQADTVIIFEENQIGNVYEVKLRVENSHGCIDSVSIQKTVLERETDLELIQLFVQEANHFLTLGVRLKNNGSTPITAVDLIINSPSTGLIKETWSGLLQAGEEENYIFSVALSAKVSAEDANRNFLCIKGNIVQPAQFTEIDMLNNEICKAMTENQMVIVQPYPNPVEDELIVKVVMPQKQVIDLYVYDSHGKRVHTITEKQELKEGLNAFVVETSTWGSGSYRIVYGKESIGIVKL